MENYTLNGATGILNNFGMREAARDLNYARAPIGVATTMASAIEGNPRAATSMLGRVAPELDSPELNTAMRFGGMAAMASMFQNFMPALRGMFGGMSGGILGNLGNSSALAMTGNVPGNPLATSFTQMSGLDSSKVSMMTVDRDTGVMARQGVSNAPTVQNVPGVGPMVLGPGIVAPSFAPNPYKMS